MFHFLLTFVLSMLLGWVNKYMSSKICFRFCSCFGSETFKDIIVDCHWPISYMLERFEENSKVSNLFLDSFQVSLQREFAQKGFSAVQLLMRSFAFNSYDLEIYDFFKCFWFNSETEKRLTTFWHTFMINPLVPAETNICQFTDNSEHF